MRSWRQRWCVGMVAALLAACPTPPPEIPSAGNDAGVVVGPPELEPVTLNVTRTRAARLTSADGVVSVVLPALAVDSSATLTLARLREDLAPAPRLGAGYVVRVEGGTLRAPARVEWSIPTDVHVPSRELRIASPDPVGAVQPVAHPQAAADVVAGEITGAAVVVLVDRRTRGEGWAKELPPASAGDALLARADVEGARAAYHAARQAGPDASAALGRGVTELLLLLGQPPLSDLLRRCGLSSDALLKALVGPGGVLAQAAEDRAGDAWFTLTDAAGATTLPADEVYARPAGGWAVLLARGTGLDVRVRLPAESLPLGVRLTRDQFHGTVVVDSSEDRFEWPWDGAGVVVLEQRGVAAGARVRVRLEGLKLTGGPGTVTLDGEVLDTLAEAPQVLASLGVREEEGPPLVPVLSALLNGCSPDVTTAWMSSVAGALADALTPVAADLADAAGAESTEPLLLLPPGLTRLPRALPLTTRDARLLHGLVELARAGLVGLQAYQVAGMGPQGVAHPVQEWLRLDTRHRWDGDAGVVAVDAVVPDLDMLAAELDAQLLAPQTWAAEDLGAALAPARSMVESALGDLRAASASSGGDGLLRWSTLDAQGVSAGLRTLAEAMLGSLPPHTAAVPLGDGRQGYAVQLSRLFDDPPTHDELVLANGGEPLVVDFDGAPAGRTPASRDAQLLWHDRGSTRALWLSFMDLAPAPPGGECQAAEECGFGYTCLPDETGSCAGAGSPCAGDEGCPAGDGCARARRCRMLPPPLVDWAWVRHALGGPRAPALAPWTWHLLQPVAGEDPAR